MIICTKPDQILENIDVKKKMTPFIVILSSLILTNEYNRHFCFEMSKFILYHRYCSRRLTIDMLYPDLLYAYFVTHDHEFVFSEDLKSSLGTTSISSSKNTSIGGSGRGWGKILIPFVQKVLVEK